MGIFCIHLYEGVLREKAFFQSDCAIVLYCTIGMLYTITLWSIRKNSLNGTLFNLKSNTKEPTAADRWRGIVLHVLSIISCSLLFLFLGGGAINAQVMLSVLLIVLGILFLKITILSFFCFAFFSEKQRKSIIRSYLSLFDLFGYIAFSGLVILVFIKSDMNLLPNIVIIATLVLISLSTIYVIFTTFPLKNISFYHLILYLCTLEILPILLLYKVFANSNGIIN